MEAKSNIIIKSRLTNLAIALLGGMIASMIWKISKKGKS